MEGNEEVLQAGGLEGFGAKRGSVISGDSSHKHENRRGGTGGLQSETAKKTKAKPDSKKGMDITTRIGCRNNCSYCPQKLLINNYLKRSNEMVLTLDNFKTCLSKIPKDITINFAGMAEPFLNPDCTEMILHTFSEGHDNVSIYTTLVGLTKKDYLRLKDLPFFFFTIHIPDNEDKTRINVDNDYLELLEFILKNQPTNRVDKDKFSLVYFDTIHKDIINILKRCKVKVVKGIIENRSNVKEFTEFEKRSGEYYCADSPLLQRNILLPSGDVTVCCMDYGLKGILGNLLKDDYASLFKENHERALKSIESGGIKGLCDSCELCRKRYSVKDIKTRTMERLVRIRTLKIIKRSFVNIFGRFFTKTYLKH